MTHERVLFFGGQVIVGSRLTEGPAPSAICLENDRIVWVGADSDAPGAHTRVDLHGLLVTPGFVDAHVHATSTGLVMTGLDLTFVRDADDLLNRIASAAVSQSTGVVLGHGWDDSQWTNPRVPTRAEIDAAAQGRAVYLSRIDVHSALVSSTLIEWAPRAQLQDGFHEVGPLSRAAHHEVREVALGGVPATQRRDAQRAFLDEASARGLVAVHEMAGPTISSEEDLSELLLLASDGTTPLVTGYWGQLSSEGGVEAARDLGAVGAAGDLLVDGSLGSRTACLHDVYSDEPGTAGAAYLTAQQVSEHVVACTRLDLQAGFHVIGDRACSIVTEGFRRAAHELGRDAVRGARHRIEHAEMLSMDDMACLSDLNVAASMQPLFDALWGGENGMYADRLGHARSRPMNRFASVHHAGVRVLLGSDAPVTAMGPWDAIRAAMQHQTVTERLDFSSAFGAHTRAAWHGVGVDNAGTLVPNSSAHLAFWDATSVDYLLNQQTPETVATMVAGRLIRDNGLVSS